MNFQVRGRFERISAFKTREVANMVRGKKAEDALAMLKFMPKKASRMLERLISSGVANAEQAEVPVAMEDLMVKTIFIDEGPTMRRFQFRAQGRVNRIRKRTSHVTIILSELETK